MDATATESTSSALRRAFGCFPSGVAAICADVEPQATGMLVSSLTSVSLDPPLLSLCVQNGSRTWSGLRTATHVGVSVLGDTHEQVCAQFAGTSAERLRGVDTRRTDQGAILLTDAAATFICSVCDEIPAGDHSIVILRIETFDTAPESAPLVFHRSRYRRLAG
ncbi:flavin reductase family protein [Williamsia herbipolensis]|uniref:flavin reductase family protein n=1 Tax=Williamsia herbipolensis TaxID=1603258 RepID=UPI0005F81BE1|nr:flavin reductase family protein [Williamsia herbipolensis]